MSEFLSFIAVGLIVFMIGFTIGKDSGRVEYFKGQIECKQAFEIIECKKVKDE